MALAAVVSDIYIYIQIGGRLKNNKMKSTKRACIICMWTGPDFGRMNGGHCFNTCGRARWKRLSGESSLCFTLAICGRVFLLLFIFFFVFSVENSKWCNDEMDLCSNYLLGWCEPWALSVALIFFLLFVLFYIFLPFFLLHFFLHFIWLVRLQL